MNKRLLLWIIALFPLVSCSLLEVGALNQNFLEPLHGLLFKNEFQVNDFQYLFDAENKTVAIKTRGASTTVDGIYSLELVSNPTTSQGIYRMTGSKSYHNFFLGLEYTQAAAGFFRAKIIIQESELKAKDALNTLSTASYVNTALGSTAYYKAASAGTWTRVSASGIYNAASTDQYTFTYNELVDTAGSEALNARHTVLVANISGTVSTRYTYNLTLLTNLSVSSAVMQSIHATDSTAPLHNRYIGYFITNLPGGKVFAKIITSSSASTDENSLRTFIDQMNNSSILDHTILNSVDRPDLQLLPLRSKGPWVFVQGDAYDLLSTTNWDFSVQDQAVTITTYSPSTGTAPVSQSFAYSLRTTGTPSVFQLTSSTSSAPLNNLYFGFKFRIRSGETVERASFYINASEGGAASLVSGPGFVDNYVNIYDASTLGAGGAAVEYRLKINPSLPSTISYLNALPQLKPLFGATLFTRNDAGREFIYVVGGAEAISTLDATTFSLYELVISSPVGLRLSIARTSTFGSNVIDSGNPAWENVTFRIAGYASTTEFVAPFGGLYAWVGNRLFIYNPVKFSTLAAFDTVPSSYRVISTTFSGDWTMAALPSAITNRAHASFFSSQAVLVLAGGLHFIEGSHKTPPSAPRGDYIITNDIWQSYNGGATWSQVSKAAGFSPRYMATTLNVGSDVFLLGGYTAETAFSSDIWKSTDNGATWAKVAGTLPAGLVSSYLNHHKGRMPGFVVNNVMYLVAANQNGISPMTTPAAIYSSRDGGKTWELESLVDSTTGGGTESRSSSLYASAYVWSPNNPIHKGVLFSIGGFPQGAASINQNIYLRALEKK